MFRTEFAMTYLLDVEGPLMLEDRQFWSMQRATLEGPNISASTPLPGIDWFTPDRNGFGRPHVRIPFRTSDDAVILLDYRGIVQSSDAFQAAFEKDRGTDRDDQYMRMALFFETDAPRYRWLKESLFLARGRLLSAKSLEYEVHRLL